MSFRHKTLPVTLTLVSLWLNGVCTEAQNPPAYNNQPGQMYQPAPANGSYQPYQAQFAPAMVPAPNQYPAPGGQMAPSNPQIYRQPPNSLAQPAMAMPMYNSTAPGGLTLGQWFSQYDQIRHLAQMSPAERQKADQLMSRGLSILVPGEEKQATKSLLSSLSLRYQRACQELRNLPQINQTSNLHQSYFQYFATAGQLFNDYVRVQDNIFVTDASTGKPVAAGLLQRKQMLEGLEHQCKLMDMQVRSQLGIAPYPW